MQKDKSSQGIVLDEKSQEQPADKERAQKTSKTKPGHMPEQRIEKDDKLQPLREKSGF
jgi:hypothetical protein